MYSAMSRKPQVEEALDGRLNCLHCSSCHIHSCMHTHNTPADYDYRLMVSYFEVYNEEINDLLADEGGRNLKVMLGVGMNSPQHRAATDDY